MPDISASGQAADAIANHASGWAEAVAAVIVAVIVGLWHRATKAGDADRHKPNANAMGDPAVALMMDSNPVRELIGELKGLRSDLADAREEERDRRAEDEKRRLESENDDLRAEVSSLRAGQSRTHNNQGSMETKIDELLKRLS